MRRAGKKDGPNHDVEDLEAFARGLHAERGSVIMFPEGHTFDGIPSEGYRHVLKPKTRGLQAMLRNAPDHAVLFVTSVWHDYDSRKGQYLATIPPGTKVTVHARVVHRPDPERIGEWLPAAWAEMDRLIEEGRRK
ncbi:MAG: hypothetical protein RLZZ324_1235 [Candidatus Parcubacteria bacterium]